MLSKFQRYQSAGVISNGGKEDFCSWGAEADSYIGRCLYGMILELVV